MTVAICYKCGEFKFGAFTPCEKCGAEPRSQDDLALALMMTDHYFDKPTLEKMSRDTKGGKPPRLAPETRQKLLQQLQSMPGIGGGTRKKPWWQFW